MISRARLRFLASLKRRKVREQEGLLLVEGLNVVEEAVEAGRARELFLAEDVATGARGRALLARGLPVASLAPRDVEALAETRTPAGAFALVEDPTAAIDPAALPREAVVLLAAGVADPGNLGTLVRTAAALGAAAVALSDGTVEATNPKVVRATAGALFRVPVGPCDAASLARAGFAVLVADAAGAPIGARRDRAPRLALAVGSEPHGVPAGVRAVAEGLVAVPVRRGVESLNVAVAAGILLHALLALPVRAR